MNLPRPIRILLCGAACLAAGAATDAADSGGAKVSTELTPDGGQIVVEAHGLPPKAPVFFSANADETVHLALDAVTAEIRLSVRVLQGKPDVLSLGLSGDGEIVGVDGPGLRDWSVRQARAGAGSVRFLDLRPAPASEGTSGPLELTVHARLRRESGPGSLAVLILSPGEAAGFSSTLTLGKASDVDFRVTAVSGLLPLGDDSGGPARFVGMGEGRIEVSLSQLGAGAADADLGAASLDGLVSPDGGSVAFRLQGLLAARKAGARLRILSGRAAPSEAVSGEGWHIELVAADAGRFAYDLVAERAGAVPVAFAFAAEIRDRGEWRTLDFAMPAGTVVPLRIEGLPSDVRFKPGSPVVPVAAGKGWRGFLPASGGALLSWKQAGESAEGALFFTTSELSELQLGAGLLRQSSRLDLRILQGKLGSLEIALNGPGEIVGVEGTNVVGWQVKPAGGGRRLEVRFSRPVESEGSLVVRSQQELGGFPVHAEPLRLDPVGVVRHSGYLRITNDGAVRLEVTGAEGMMQLSPEQFPAPAGAAARQVFVYRFPSASHAFRIAATEIQPEVAVSEITTYELSETDRVIDAALELDIREAPLRDWTFQVPEGYTLASAVGSDVADTAAEASAVDGYRPVRVLFSRSVSGRQLLRVRLERNEPASAGAWSLRPLRFPGAKSVRGHVGVVSVAGFRIAPTRVDQLAEIPLTYFPRQTPGLQEAWRLRESEWTADLKIEAVGQSVQADVFHLYTIKEGVVYGSVLLNYFVVGAPATEWRIRVPQSVGNIDVAGEGVQRDWRREGDQVVVSLHQPVLGPGTLLVTFEQPMSARGGTIDPGVVQPLGVQAERGYIEVVSPFQVKSGVRKAEGALLKLEVKELPAEFRLLSSAPALAVYQYTARPFSLEVGVDWFAPAETADQAVDFARLTSRVSRDGQVVTDARYFIKTRGRKALRILLPAGVRLWEARVDGEAIVAQADGAATLIPLPARLNVDVPVSVELRLGQAAAGSGSSIPLAAPKALAPTVVTEWSVHADSGRLLVPEGGNARLAGPALTETGFEWVSRRAPFGVACLAGLAALGLLLFSSSSSWRFWAGLSATFLAGADAVALAGDALINRRASVPVLTYSASLLPPGEGISVQVGNVAGWQALVVGWGLAAIAAGLALGLASRTVRWRSKAALLAPASVLLVSAGLLAQRGGAVLFFAAAAGVLATVPGLAWARRASRAPRPAVPPGAGAAAAASMLGLVGVGILALASPSLRAEGEEAPRAASMEDNRPSQSLVQNWVLRNDRLFAEADLTVRGNPGDAFLLLNPPALLTEFKGEGLRVSKVEREGHTRYYVIPERAGILAAHVRFEMPVPDRSRAIPVPTGPAATQRITVELDQGGWEFASPAAVQILATAGLGTERSGATLVLGPQGAPTLLLRPKRRNAADEATQFYVETSNLYTPGPGVVDGHARVTVRPAQGRVSALDLDVPKAFTVGDVTGAPVGSWRFDPQTHRLHVAIEPAQAEAFRFDVETQMGAGALPYGLSLQPVRVLEAAGQVGFLAIAFGSEAQPEAVAPSGLSPVNIQDVDAGLAPKGRDKAVTVQQAWRFGQQGGRVDLRVAAVAPEVRVTSRQVLSLDDDRLVMAVDLEATITRAGLFQLSFAIPEGLEIEALSGPSLAQWTESQDGPARIATLHLSGRTMGAQPFALTLTGAAPKAQDAWSVPHIRVREAQRQTGDVVLVPGRGLRLRVAGRDKATPIDPRSVGGELPGTLAFRLLEADGSLRIGIEALEPWVTIQSLEELTLREGQAAVRIALHCRVDNAAVKLIRIRLPGLAEDQAGTVRATGPAVADMVRVPGAPDLWELRFQRGIAGETDALIEYQGPRSEAQDTEAVTPPDFPGARQVAQFIALRGGGRLELEADTLPRGWTRQDWGGVPAALQSRSDRSIPALCFRVAEAEAPLAVAVRRHEVAESLKLRVTQGELRTVFSPSGSYLTAVDLRIEVLEKGLFRVRLPERARLFAARVNGESVSAVREGDAYLLNVGANSEADHTASVRLVYSLSGSASGDVVLVGPGLSAPLENVTWRVVVPPGYDLRRHGGGFRLVGERAAAPFGVEQYVAAVRAENSAEAQKAAAALDEANSLLQSGDQERAGELFSRASNAQALDEASNEDARVQLRNLRTQQTVLGLNTRRQKLYLDNRAEGTRNEQLEQAASLNPYLQGKVNFDPQQIDQVLMGNTVEENAALRGIASRLVDQQLSGTAAPTAIDVTLPERGRVVTFARSLQVDGNAPLELTLSVGPAASASLGYSLFLLAAVALLASIPSIRAAGRP
jgi:hypothetical protein